MDNLSMGKSPLLARTCFLAFIIMFCFSCVKEENPVDENVEESRITSEDFIEGIFVLGHEDTGYELKIETNNPVVFSAHSSRRTFEVDPSGIASLDLPQGVYWLDCVWADKPDVRTAIPVLITKNKGKAKELVSVIKKLETEANGYTLVLRHAKSSIGDDKVNSIAEWWKSCDPNVARQMDEAGIQQSRQIGSILKSLNAPIGKVTTSEFCRAVQTIEQMGLDLAITQDARLNHQNQNTKSPIFEDVYDIIKNSTTANKLQVLVGHYNLSDNMPDRDFFMPFAMGDGLLLKSNANGAPTIVGGIPFFYWEAFE